MTAFKTDEERREYYKHLKGESRPLLLDLFCCAGGAALGYYHAGFKVVGVDLNPQPNYPFEFMQADALSLNPITLGYGFDAIHASPPCQAYSALRSLHKTREYVDLIDQTRDLLEQTGLPYVIENVEQARKRMRNPILICGSMFDPVMDVKRHRLFEANWPLEDPQWPCRHSLWDFRYRSLDQRKKKGSRVVQVHGGSQHVREYALSRVVGVHGHENYTGERELRERAMGIDWMTPHELTQAIPPAYTELVGTQLLAWIREGVA